MNTLLWLLMIASQIMWIVIIFGGLKNAPQWLKICIGIGECLMLVAVFGLAMDK